MQAETQLTEHTHQSKSTSRQSVFFMRLKKTSKIVAKESRVWCLIFYVIYVFSSFFFGIKIVATVVEYIKIPVIVYLVGTYLTLLPTYVVLVLIFVPRKFVIPMLGLAVLFSFLMVFVI